MKKRAELDHKRFTQQSANQSTVVQLVNGMQEIKLSACEQQKRWEWERIQARLFKVNIRQPCLAAVSGFGSDIDKPDEKYYNYGLGGKPGGAGRNDIGYDVVRTVYHWAIEQSGE